MFPDGRRVVSASADGTLKLFACSTTLAATDEDEGVAPRDVAIETAHLAVDSVLSLGGAVPDVGDFFDLIANFKDQWMELVGRIDEANEVATWAQNEIYLLDQINKQINRRGDAGSNVPAEKALKRAAIKLNESIKQLVAEAKRISAGGARARQLFRGAIHKRHFEAAQGAVQEARKIFSQALAVDTNEMVHDTNQTVDDMKQKLDAVIRKIDAKANAN